MIDFTDRDTLMTIKAALRRALNSLDNDIGAVKQAHMNEALTTSQAGAKLGLLQKSRDDTRRIYDAISL